MIDRYMHTHHSSYWCIYILYLPIQIDRQIYRNIMTRFLNIKKYRLSFHGFHGCFIFALQNGFKLKLYVLFSLKLKNDYSTFATVCHHHLLSLPTTTPSLPPHTFSVHFSVNSSSSSSTRSFERNQREREQRKCFLQLVWVLPSPLISLRHPTLRLSLLSPLRSF